MAMKMPDYKEWLRKIAAFFRHNWTWKLLSLLLAIFLWSLLITQDDSLLREKVFNDVAINVLNADTLRRNGFIIVDGLDDLPTARIRVDVPQKMYNTVTSSNYNLRVDLSRIRGAGEQTLSVLSSSSNTYGTVTETSVETVTVQVEEYVSRSRIPVRLNATGDAPAGFYASEARVDPTYVVVSGPKSQVDQVVRCVADYDMSVLTPQSGVERTATPFRLVNAEGEQVDSSLIEVAVENVSVDSITVEQTLYTAKTLVINTTDLVSGLPAAGYAIRRISAEPATITIAGSDQAMNALTELHLVEFIDQQLDVNNLSTPITRNVSLNKPSGIAYISNDTVIITVDIAPR